MVGLLAFLLDSCFIFLSTSNEKSNENISLVILHLLIPNTICALLLKVFVVEM
jgi:hypothetical protein